MNRISVLILLLFLGWGKVTAQVLESPSKQLTMEFSLSKKGEPMYKVNLGSSPVILPSSLGFDLKNDDIDLLDGFQITKTETTSFDETWTPVWGEESQILSISF
jgi:hypothetical protein